MLSPHLSLVRFSSVSEQIGKPSIVLLKPFIIVVLTTKETGLFSSSASDFFNGKWFFTVLGEFSGFSSMNNFFSTFQLFPHLFDFFQGFQDFRKKTP